MNHQRYPSQDVIKEPHPLSLKVLRLSRPSLVPQHTLAAPSPPEISPLTAPASFAYRSPPSSDLACGTNSDPFLLSPILNLPPSFGSAYVGEVFACTLCVNHDAFPGGDGGDASVASSSSRQHKIVRDVRVEAEMKTPSTAGVVKLELVADSANDILGDDADRSDTLGVVVGSGGIDLEAGQTLQTVVRFDLKEEGNHVLAVTVSYYEATETSGRTRTFRKLYQFICKSSLIVRTKAGPYRPAGHASTYDQTALNTDSPASPFRRWILEAQLENCGEDVLQLNQVVLQLEPALSYEDCNDWEGDAIFGGTMELPSSAVGRGGRRPVLHPGEVEQVSFLILETAPGIQEDSTGRLLFGVLGIGWRGEMGSRGFLSTGKLGTRSIR